jgi:L-threonylcarbamoyladenylate synthase
MSQSQFVSKCTADAMVLAAQKLIDGDLVAFPTETVYGLGADATNEMAIAKIYAAKGRPADHPLIVHLHSMEAMGEWSDEIPAFAIALARDFWPGPMTLILNRSSLAQDFITGGQNSVGIRVPDHVVALALLNAFHGLGGKGIAAPSANRFGHVSPTTAQAVKDELGSCLNEQDQILDGGPCTVGVESTIIDCTGDVPKILRPGAITAEMITASTGLVVAAFNDLSDLNSEMIRVSGSLEKHYAPKAQIILDVQAIAGQGFIAPAVVATPSGAIRLASPANIDEYARTLYSALREGDARGLATIAIIQPRGDGLAMAIRDRLIRASNGR